MQQNERGASVAPAGFDAFRVLGEWFAVSPSSRQWSVVMDRSEIVASLKDFRGESAVAIVKYDLTVADAVWRALELHDRRVSDGMVKS